MKGLKFKTRIILIFFLSYTLLSVSLIGLFYSKSVILQKEQLRARLMQLSSLATNLVKSDIIKNLVPARASMQTPEYSNLVGDLRKITAIDPAIADAYILVDTGKPGIMKFVANADSVNVVDCGEEYDVLKFPELPKAFDGPAADKKITSDRWGHWLSGYAPIRDEENAAIGILGIDISAGTIYSMQNMIKRIAFYVFITGILLALASGKIVSLWLTKPVNMLIKGMEKIKSGDLDYKIDVNADDELGILSQNFNFMAMELKKYIENLTETTKEKERVTRELEIAAEMQKAMLPHYNLDVEELDIAGLSLPAKQVGGDYFDYMNEEGNNIGFVIADATGKGLPSSIFMTNSKSIFKVMTTEETSPGKVIQRTNDIMIKEFDPAASMFATMFYGIYNKDTSRFVYSNAGHNPPILIDSAHSTEKLLKSHGCPIGIIKDQIYAEDEIIMQKGDMVILYTDGVVEAMNEKNEMYGIQKLMKLVLDNKGLLAQELIDKIRNSVFEFAGGRLQYDDITLLIFKVR